MKKFKIEPTLDHDAQPVYNLYMSNGDDNYIDTTAWTDTIEEAKEVARHLAQDAIFLTKEDL